jgi:hypothetical protein
LIAQRSVLITGVRFLSNFKTLRKLIFSPIPLELQ